MSHEMPTGALLPVRHGHLFVRGTRAQAKKPFKVGKETLLASDFERPEEADAVIVAGVVEVPASLAVEALYGVRLQDGLWLDPHSGIPLTSRIAVDRKGDPRTWTADTLLTHLPFRTGTSREDGEVVGRASALPSTDAAWQWVLVVGTCRRRPTALPQDGLYAVDAVAGALVPGDTDPRTGLNIQGVFGACLWGTTGDRGLRTAMELTAYPAWLASDRQENIARDPGFRRFMEAVRASDAPELPMAYTADEFAVWQIELEWAVLSGDDREGRARSGKTRTV